MQRVTLARNAMATRFEFVLVGENAVQLRAAGEEAFDEVARIEALLSLYRASSDIAQVNARAAHEPVRVSPEVFELLTASRAFSEATGGLFDISIAPLVRCWGFMKGSGSRPSDAEIAAAKELVGMERVELDPEQRTVRFAQAGMMLDLGGVGKGYALDVAASTLRDAGVSNALLHGGTSTVCGLGSDPEQGPWKVAIELPQHADSKDAAELLSVATLGDASLSVSAIWGKFFELEGETYGHVIDPRTAWPARNALLGAAVIDSATVSDALSTAILLGHDADLEKLKSSFAALKLLQVTRQGRAASGLDWVSSAGINRL